MNEWTKISWRDAVDKNVFDDELGFIHINREIRYDIGQHDINNYYEDNGTGQKTRLGIDTSDISKVKALFSKTIYMAQQQNYYYGSVNYVPIEVETINPVISYRRIQAQNNGYGRAELEHYFPIDKKNKKRLDYLRYVWICDEIQDEQVALKQNNLKMPLLQDLSTGDALFCSNKGRVKIHKIYQQPNKDNLMLQCVCDYEDCDKEPFDILVDGTNCEKIYYLPYDKQPISEIERFNVSVNELDLSPYVLKCGQRINVFWHNAYDAAQYVISVYKKFYRNYIKKIYHLKDYEIDRNDGFISIDGLLGSDYILTIKAESRNGEVVALSRGIAIDDNNNTRFFPQFWEDN